jgi:hypothetical protein
VTADAGTRPGVLTRITAATAFGEGLDGHDLGVISVVLPLATTALDLSTVEAGLGTAAADQRTASAAQPVAVTSLKTARTVAPCSRMVASPSWPGWRPNPQYIATPKASRCLDAVA